LIKLGKTDWLIHENNFASLHAVRCSTSDFLAYKFYITRKSHDRNRKDLQHRAQSAGNTSKSAFHSRFHAVGLRFGPVGAFAVIGCQQEIRLP
jgi:hypothetical protein